MAFGRSFEEFEVGAVYKHWPGKTITEYDHHLFSMLTMVRHPLHLDSHYAQTATRYQQPLVIGSYIFSLLLGLSALLHRLVGWSFSPLGFRPALLALTLYSILPILRNGITAILNLDPAILQAALGVGMTSHQRLLRVELPLAAPILAVIGLISFIFALNEFVIASAILQTTHTFTLAVGMRGFIDQQYGQRWGPFAAGSLIAAIPPTILFMTLQKWIVGGLTQGAVKG